jgi:hypothetical protein
VVLDKTVESETSAIGPLTLPNTFANLSIEAPNIVLTSTKDSIGMLIGNPVNGSVDGTVAVPKAL